MMKPKSSPRKNATSEIETSSQLSLTEVEVLPPQSTRTRIRKPRNLPRTEPPLFTNKSVEMMASGAPVISATQAFLKPPDWSEYGQDRLYFQKQFGKGRYIEFYVLNKQKHQADSISSQAEREILEQYGVMAARLHAVFASYAAIQSEPWKQPFYLLGTDLIKTLKVHNSNKFTKSQKLKAIADLAWVVGTLGAVIHWFEGDMDLCVRERSLLWIVSVQEYTQPHVDGETEELHEVVIRVQPGLWTHNFLNREGAQQQKALYQYGLIPKEVFDIDPHRRKLATSMGLYLIQNSRARPNGIYTIESLIESVLPSNEIERALSDRRYGWKLKESVDNALLTLKDNLKIEIGFDDETYPVWLRPVWSLPDEIALLPTKERNQQLLGSKWLPDNYISKHWFPAKISFKLPSQIQECLDDLEARRTEKSHRSSARRRSVEANIQPTMVIAQLPAVELAGATVKAARQAKGWTQAQLASTIGKSVSWVKLVESDRRRAVDSDQSLLRQVLNIQ
ncbi:helix-turn-helix transcriptional regulator [Leptolyngbya sp. FACHB-16]|uniref:helix-turn-helix domain-containing protein n=1 Tax=unclassified Leptolyngbya TaxID=2650499 RepID=UPI001686E8F0|nr:helix-turn-helix transcriptional regulator [Leptolyngbya sp. FACHB-16]MBD2158890.1 helix-turn-helix domain-containing protein [Leptolyngbya sp. FACHB-16]